MRQLLQKKLKNEKGLTLIELLAVIVILGIIAAIAIPSIGNVIQKSREDAIKADAIQIINATKMYISAEGATSSIHVGGKNPDNTDNTNNPLANYLDSVTTFSEYTVNIGPNNNVTFTGKGSKGNVDITFTNATLKGINSAPRGAGPITN